MGSTKINRPEVLKISGIPAFGNEIKVSKVDFGIRLTLSEGDSTEVQEEGAKVSQYFWYMKGCMPSGLGALRGWKEKIAAQISPRVGIESWRKWEVVGIDPLCEGLTWYLIWA